MSQVKSSSHSPHCIEHSPYPPCVPTCRMTEEMKVMPAGYQWPAPGVIALYNIDPDPIYADLFLKQGKLLPKAAPIKQEFGPLPKEPFQPLGIRLTPDTEVHSLAITKPDGDLYASFDEHGTLTGGWLHKKLNALEATDINRGHAMKAVRKDEKRWMKIAIASWLILVADVTYGIGRYWWGW